MKTLLLILALAMGTAAHAYTDNEILEHGEITGDQAIGGGLLGTFIGFGLGHAVQHRYSGRGFTVTLGELGGVGLVIAGAAMGFDQPGSHAPGALFIGAGFLTFAVFKVYEIIDVWATPGVWNHRYHDLQGAKGALTRPQLRYIALQAPVTGQNSGSGIALSWQF